MKNVLIINDCKYAQYKPSLPVLEFVKGETVCLEDYLADSIIANGDGGDITVEPETSVEPETKEKPRKPVKARGGKKE